MMFAHPDSRHWQHRVVAPLLRLYLVVHGRAVAALLPARRHDEENLYVWMALGQRDPTPPVAREYLGMTENGDSHLCSPEETYELIPTRRVT